MKIRKNKISHHPEIFLTRVSWARCFHQSFFARKNLVYFGGTSETDDDLLVKHRLIRLLILDETFAKKNYRQEFCWIRSIHDSSSQKEDLKLVISLLKLMTISWRSSDQWFRFFSASWLVYRDCSVGRFCCRMIWSPISWLMLQCEIDGCCWCRDCCTWKKNFSGIENIDAVKMVGKEVFTSSADAWVAELFIGSAMRFFRLQ